MGQQDSRQGLVKRQFGHRARLALDPAQVTVLDAQGHAARTTWNLLHDWWRMLPKAKRTLAAADTVIRQGRRELDWLGVLPAQAAQAVLKTYFQAWKNCWEGRARAPEFKARFRTRMSIDIPQGRDLHVVRVHRRWGMVSIPRLGRVRFRWTKDLPVGKHADNGNKISGARLVKDALGWHIAFRVTTLAPAPARIWARRSASTPGSPSRWPCPTAKPPNTAPGSARRKKPACSTVSSERPAARATARRASAPATA
ncbi:hypothetical protein GCM10023080_036880 [Streptomyces pseudoechinosporeus]